MNLEKHQLEALLRSVHKGFSEGKNLMELVRSELGIVDNNNIASLLSYDLRAGKYNNWYRNHQDAWTRWTEQIASKLFPFLPKQGSLVEVGCGEASSLAGVLKVLQGSVEIAYGFDISWSRIDHGLNWLKEKQQTARLFVADLFHIPLADNSIDVVYTCHSLEPNRGREIEAIRECLRVARKALVLIEPIYELVNKEQKERMLKHGYVQGLREAAEQLGEYVLEYRLLEYSLNPMNPSGVIVIQKNDSASSCKKITQHWQCPLTSEPLYELEDVFCVTSMGIVYPCLRGIPMLRPEHAIVASKLCKGL